MEEGASNREEDGLVLYSEQAEWDLSEVHLYTDLRWSPEQADLYITFLQDCCKGIAIGDLPSRPVAGGSTLRAYLARWQKAKAGHYVIFQPLDQGIYVVAFLHSSMNTEEHISSRLTED